MKLRFFRRTTFTVRGTSDLGRLAWQVMSRWKVPHIDLRIDALPLLEAQRSQMRLRRLHEVLERQTGGLLAIAVLIVGLADMVRTWNRDLEHMGMLVLAAIAAGLAGRLIARTIVRLRFLLELLLLRRRIRKAMVAGAARGAAPASGMAAPAAASGRTSGAPPAAVMTPTAQTGAASAAHEAPADLAAAGSAPATALAGRCGCGAVTFTLSRRPLLMGTCHCATCRKTGNSTLVFARRSTFTLLSGQEQIATGEPDAWHGHTRCFCARCGSALGAINSTSHEVPLPAHLFDGEIGIRNGFHQLVAEKPAWHEVCDGAMQFPGARPA